MDLYTIILAIPEWLDHTVAWAQVLASVAAVVALYGLWKKNEDLIKQNELLSKSLGVQQQALLVNGQPKIKLSGQVNTNDMVDEIQSGEADPGFFYVIFDVKGSAIKNLRLGLINKRFNQTGLYEKHEIIYSGHSFTLCLAINDTHIPVLATITEFLYEDAIANNSWRQVLMVKGDGNLWLLPPKLVKEVK